MGVNGRKEGSLGITKAVRSGFFTHGDAMKVIGGGISVKGERSMELESLCERQCLTQRTTQ